jgi:hypothetical protein
MKNTKIVITSLILVIVSSFRSINGQESEFTIFPTEASELELLNRLRLDRNMKAMEEVSYERIEGDPFLYQDFVRGNLLLKTGESIPLNFRFDIFKGEIQFGKKDEIYALINPERVSSVLMDTLRFVYSGYLKSPEDISSVENSWFILKKDGKVRLLIRKNLRLQAVTPPKPYKEEGSPAKFIHTRDTYYVQPEGGSAVKIDNKKNLLDLLPDKNGKLDSFIKANNLDVKKVDDLAKIISFYNSL